jgi:hypothetical protein
LRALAERYFPEDPNTALIKLRQLGERLAQQVASRFGLFSGLEDLPPRGWRMVMAVFGRGRELGGG